MLYISAKINKCKNHRFILVALVSALFVMDPAFIHGGWLILYELLTAFIKRA